MFEALIRKASESPIDILKIDAVGACVSAIMLGLVLPRLHDLFGIPLEMLYFLAAHPVFFVLLDILFISRKRLQVPGLKVIALLNAMFCAASLALMLAHLSSIKLLGIAYLIGEICLVLCIAWVEWMAYRRLRTPS